MFLGGEASQRLEPVCIMCSSLFNCPFLDGCGYHISDGRIQVFSSFNSFAELIVDALRKILAHSLVIEDIGAKNIHDRMRIFHNPILSS